MQYFNNREEIAISYLDMSGTTGWWTMLCLYLRRGEKKKNSKPAICGRIITGDDFEE